MKKRFFCVLLAAALLACVPGAFAEETAAEDAVVEAVVPEGTIIKVDRRLAAPGGIRNNNPEIEGESPLTGLPCTEPYTPIVLPLDNSPEAQPLWGISDASILFQVPLGPYGSTRLMALYSDAYPEQAGGVRSGRMTMLPLARAFHAAFVYAGVPPIGSGDVSVNYYLTQWSFRKPTRHYDLMGRRFRERVDFIKKPFNLSAHVKELHDHLAKRKMTFEVRPFLFADEPLTRGEEATEVSLQFQSYKHKGHFSRNSACTFTWTDAGYTRTSFTGEMTDRNTGKALAFANVIIMRVPVEWHRDYPFFEDHMRGTGQADIFQNGRYIRGTWSHPSRTDRVVFFDEEGNELAFQRGKTFLVLGDENVFAYRR